MRWLCVLACTSFNFMKRWLFVLCFVSLFIVGTLSVGIGHNSFIYATNIHKFLVISWLGIVFLLQIIKRTFDILKTYETYMCVHFGGPTAVVTQ